MVQGFLLSIATARALTCEDYAPAVQAAIIPVGSPIVEASGLAASRTRPGVWFTHNDSGGISQVYAFTLDGTYLEAHDVTGASFVDWEDMDAAPCPGGTGDCLYVGDIGDNTRSRESIQVYAFAEPQPGEAGLVSAIWAGRYPEGAQDAESLFVHPLTGRIYLATKDSGSKVSVIWRFPETPSDVPQDLERVAEWTVEGGGAATTGADWDLDGERLVIRTYGVAFEWQTDPCEPEAHWGTTPRHWPVGDSRGEAIAYDLVGDLWAITEGEAPVLTHLACTAVGGAAGCDTGEGDSDADTDTDTDADTDSDADTDTAGDSGPFDPGDTVPLDRPEDGCGGCAARPAAGWAWLAGGLVLALRRRRRIG